MTTPAHDETADNLANSAAADLVAAWGELPKVHKGKTGQTGHRRYSYVPIEDVIEVVRAVFIRHGLAVFQPLTTNEDTGIISVHTWVLHKSGHVWDFERRRYDPNANPQVQGSAESYARRYALIAAFTIATTDEDDDGALAAAHKGPPERYDELTRPVTREKVTAPQADAWTTPQPIEPGERPEPGSPSNGRKASDKSVKMMWSMLRQTRMSDDEVREWVSIVTGRPVDWHTDDLDQFEVSSVISRLKDEPPA